MENKKMIKIVFTIIGIFFVFAIIESSIRSIIGLANRYSQKREEQKQEEMEYHSDKQITERQIKEFLDDIIDAIEDKDYNYVFDFLDEAYKECIFDNEVMNLKTYMEDNINVGEGHEYIRINQSGGLYQVLVGFNDENNYSSQGYTVNVVNNNKCTFMFGEYTTMEKLEVQASYANIIYQISHYYETPDVMGYVLSIENLTTDEIKVAFKQSAKLVSTNGEVFQGNQPNAIVIKPHEKNKVELIFPKQTTGKTYIQLDVAENDEEKNVMISLYRDTM